MGVEYRFHFPASSGNFDFAKHILPCFPRFHSYLFKIPAGDFVVPFIFCLFDADCGKSEPDTDIFAGAGYIFIRNIVSPPVFIPGFKVVELLIELDGIEEFEILLSADIL